MWRVVGFTVSQSCSVPPPFPGTALSRDRPFPGPPKMSLLFFLLPPQNSFCSSLSGVFSWIFGGVFEGRDPQMCPFGLSGCRVKPRRPRGAGEGKKNAAGQKKETCGTKKRHWDKLTNRTRDKERHRCVCCVCVCVCVLPPSAGPPSAGPPSAGTPPPPLPSNLSAPTPRSLRLT